MSTYNFDYSSVSFADDTAALLLAILNNNLYW